MKRIGTLKGIPVVEGNSNELKKNNILCNKKDGKIELSKRENGQVSNISGGSNGDSGNGNKNNNIIYIKIGSSFDSVINYVDLFLISRQFGFKSEKYTIKESTILVGGSDHWIDILIYSALYCRGVNVPTDSSGTSFLNYNSLEEYEQLNGLDSNNRPFKIITEEEFYKDLTEEEARKIASEL